MPVGQLTPGQAPLPPAAETYPEALGVLKLIPWNGEPINKHNPTGPVRTLPFGTADMVTYLIVEDQRGGVREVVLGGGAADGLLTVHVVQFHRRATGTRVDKP